MKKIKLNGELLKLKFKKDHDGNYFLFTWNGVIVNDYQEIDGELYTETQIENLLNDGEIFTCEDCGGYFFMDDSYYIEDANKYVCSDCRRDYYYCEDCGNYYTRDGVYYIEDLNNYVCRDCFDSGYYGFCDCCGDCFTTDALHYSDRDGCYYCDDCYESDNIYQYHEFDDWREYRIDEKDNGFLMGSELEIDNGHDESSAAACVYENLNAVCMRDGSLADGFEIVSHPQSYNYIMAHKDALKRTFEDLIDYGYESHNTSTCGLHFHVTAPKENRHEIVSRLWAILEFYKNEIVKLSRRSESQMHWCKWLSDERELKSIEYYHIKGMSKDYTRYLAINDTNPNTIEFRFFRGTLKFETYLAAIQFINNLYTMASDLNIKLQDITWDKLTQGEYINEYVNERGILTTDVIIDNYEAISTYDFYLQLHFKQVFKMLEKKQREFYKEQIERLKATTNLYDIQSKIEYINDEANNRVKRIRIAKSYVMSKDYTNAFDTIREDMKDYIYRYIHGAKDMARHYDSIMTNIDKLEEVILCA